jgi:hypothetical protein
MTEKEYRANDPRQVNKRKEKAKTEREKQIDELRDLLHNEAFRRYIWRHINETCGVMRSAFSPNGSTQTLNIGMQDAGRRMWAEIEEADPKAIPLMMCEYAEAQAK